MASYYETSDFRNGLKVEVENVPFTVVYFQFVKPGKGTAFTRTKLKNLLTGAVIERTYRTGETLAAADVEEHTMQYLYPSGTARVFMNTESFEQVEIEEASIGEDSKFLMENMEVQVLFWRQKPINITLPTFIECKIVRTEPAVRGNTSGNVLKDALL
ncbi:MAG TPA: elongation factor P, partial [Myxococcota bacterium]|nr:elongation factor P [Myxococcota bacterium]